METRSDQSYASLQYWNDRYARQLCTKASSHMVQGYINGEDSNSDAAHEEADALEFDWLCEFDDIQPLLVHLLRPNKEVKPTDLLDELAQHPPEYVNDRSRTDRGAASNSIKDLVSMLRKKQSQQRHMDSADNDALSGMGDLSASSSSSDSHWAPHRGCTVLDLGIDRSCTSCRQIMYEKHCCLTPS